MLVEVVHWIDLILGRILPVSDDGAPGAQEIPLGFAHRCNIGVHKLGFHTVVESDLNPLLVGIGDIVPDPFMACSDYFGDVMSAQADNPIDVMSSPPMRLLAFGCRHIRWHNL